MAQDAIHDTSAVRQRSRALLDSSVDRDAAFRRAGRHSVLVRTLRWALPLSSLAMVIGYAAMMQKSIRIGWGDKQIAVDRIEINREALVAHNPRYTGFDKQGGEFEVKASTAEQDLKQKGLVRLKSIDGRLTDASRQTTTLRSPRGTLDTNTNVLEMYERIDVSSQNGMNAELTRATVFTKENRIVSDEPVTVRMPSGTVRGNAMAIDQKQKKVLFSGGVVTHLQGQPKPAAALPADPAMRGSQTQAGPGRTDVPIDITSSRLMIDDAGKLATFSGKVVARQADQVMESEQLEVEYEGQANGQGQPKAMPGDQQGRLRKLRTPGDVVLTRGAEKATGSSGEFDAISDRATLMGPVVISAGVDRGATADRADIDNKSDSILLTGNVVVTQQKNELKGRRLLADRKQGTMRLESPANAGLPKGQISAKLYQADNDGAARKGAQAPTKAPGGGAATGTGTAPGSGLLGGGLRGDPSQPIEITADTLDVDDKKKTAIFRGKVRALQGEYTIVTEELQATYTGDTGMALGNSPGGSAASAAAVAGQPKTGAQLKEVSAPRRVDIIAKDGQRASGNSAVFDPKANTARLTGNVLLTQGKTATSGNCALLDMGTGLMKIVDACGYHQSSPSTTGPATAAAALPSATVKQIAPAVTQGRAQLILVPGELQEEQKQKRALEKSKAQQVSPAATPSGQVPPTAAAKSTTSVVPLQPAATTGTSDRQAPAPRPARPSRMEDASASPFGN